MYQVKEKYIVDSEGKKTEVILPIDDYYRLLSELEDLEEIRLYDKAKSVNEEVIPFDTAMKEIGL
jgi:hypothetical protein